MVRQKHWTIIIVTAVIAAVIIGGGIWLWQQYKPIEQPNMATQEETTQAVRTSQELMKELILKNNPNATVENYKIFEEIKSPYSIKTAVLFGLNPDKTEDACCSEPVGIFINNEGALGKEYDILKGALNHLFLDNVRWQDDKTVFYDFVIFDEGGKQATEKSIEVE